MDIHLYTRLENITNFDKSHEIIAWTKNIAKDGDIHVSFNICDYNITHRVDYMFEITKRIKL